MTGVLARLIDHALAPANALQPRTPARFEPMSAPREPIVASQGPEARNPVPDAADWGLPRQRRSRPVGRSAEEDATARSTERPNPDLPGPAGRRPERGSPARASDDDGARVRADPMMAPQVADERQAGPTPERGSPSGRSGTGDRAPARPGLVTAPTASPGRSQPRRPGRAADERPSGDPEPRGQPPERPAPAADAAAAARAPAGTTPGAVPAGHALPPSPSRSPAGRSSRGAEVSRRLVLEARVDGTAPNGQTRSGVATSDDRWLPVPSPAARPTVRVSIGRIEVRAVMPPPAPARRPAPEPSLAPALSDYLRARNGGR